MGRRLPTKSEIRLRISVFLRHERGIQDSDGTFWSWSPALMLSAPPAPTPDACARPPRGGGGPYSRASLSSPCSSGGQLGVLVGPLGVKLEAWVNKTGWD